jgi:hypothetical protein
MQGVSWLYFAKIRHRAVSVVSDDVKPSVRLQWFGGSRDERPPAAAGPAQEGVGRLDSRARALAAAAIKVGWRVRKER